MHFFTIISSFLTLGLIQVCFVKAQVKPQVSGTPSIVANVTDPSLTRDSCGSVKVGNRALWICRDTSGYKDGQKYGAIVPNSASWTDFDANGNPLIIHDAPIGAASNNSNPVLLMYGGSYNSSNAQPFYPMAASECASKRGFCNATERYAIWPNQPPMVAEATSKSVTAYTWISKNLIYRNSVDTKALEPVYANQPHSLYRFDYSISTNDTTAAPQPQLVNSSFWAQGEWGYGAFGQVMRNGTAYLYAQTDDRTQVAIAKVPAGSIEDKAQYEYFVNGMWTSRMPALNNSAAFISQMGKAWQGSFWYSEAFASYIWIGEYPSVSSTPKKIDFVLSTAPNPEGPWEKPYFVHSEPRGDVHAGAYSIQAHPDLISHPATNRSIYLTYTFHGTPYITPLILMQFK